MKRKLFLFLFLFIISIFGNLKEEQIERKHLYILIESEIKERKNEPKAKYALLNIQNNQNSQNGKRERLQSSDNILINFNFPPIIRVKLPKKNFHQKYKDSFFYTIIQRYPKRILRI